MAKRKLLSIVFTGGVTLADSSLPFTLKVALEVILKSGFVRGNTILTVLIGVNVRSYADV